jgi:gliding motility-associated-like protein
VIITAVHSLSSSASRNITICNGQSFFAGGRLRTVAGTYVDTLTSSIRCDSILTTVLSVNPYTFSSRDIYICPGSTIVLGGIARSSPGTYYDTLTNSIGCDSILSTVLHLHPISTASRSLSICHGGSIVLGGLPRTTAGTYYDTLANYLGCDSILNSVLSFTPYSSGSRNVRICPGGSMILGGIPRTSAGTYYDTLTNYLGCDSILSSILSLTPYSTGSRALAICQNQSITLGGAARTTAGTYFDTLSNYAGCDSILSTVLTVHPLPAIDAGADTSLCLGQSFRRLVSGAGSFVWNDGTRGNALIITPTSSSLFTVSLTDGNACTSIDSINITVNPLPVLLVQDTTVCLGKSARLHAGGASSYRWSNGATVNATTVTPVLDNDYSVVGVDANGCTDSATIHVTVSSVSTDILATPDSTIHYEQSATLQAILSSITDSVLSWAPDEAIDTLHGNIVHVTPLHSMYYSVQVVNMYGCRGVDSILIRVIPPDLMVVPTGFSPNRDGVNDFLRPKLGPNLELTAFRIYNRYGEVVFDFPENADQNGWDGMYKERDQPMGVYVWYGEARNKLTGTTIHNSGNVTLLR